MVQWPIEEVEGLRGSEVHMRNQKLDMGVHVEVTGITAAQVCLHLKNDSKLSYTSINIIRASPTAWLKIVG